jgi:hypothetical protein
MRTLRVLVIGVLIAGVLAVSASGAIASAPAVSKICRSLNPLNQKLQKALSSADSGKVDSGAVKDVSTSFGKAAKSGPKTLKSAMSTIAAVAANVAHASSTAGAAAALKNGGAKLTSALVTWGAYIAKNCSGSTVPTT